MLTLPIQAIPRQQIIVTLDGYHYDITLVAVQDMMYATILCNGVAIVSGARCVSGFPILTCKAQIMAGNFIFDTPSNNNPWWQDFGLTHYLYYVTALELSSGSV